MVEEVKKRTTIHSSTYTQNYSAFGREKKSHRNGRKTLTYLRQKQASEQSDENLLCVFCAGAEKMTTACTVKLLQFLIFTMKLCMKSVCGMLCLCEENLLVCLSDSEKYNQHLLKKKLSKQRVCGRLKLSKLDGPKHQIHVWCGPRLNLQFSTRFLSWKINTLDSVKPIYKVQQMHKHKHICAYICMQSVNCGRTLCMKHLCVC